MKVEILHSERIFEGFINLDKAKIRFEQFDGTLSPPVTRLNAHRGDAVAVLLYDSKLKTFTFVQQFRYPVYTTEPDNAWVIEVVAGSVEGKDDLITTVCREVHEEVGYQVEPHELLDLGRCYPSPGGTSERIFMYAIDVTNKTRSGGGGGLAEEAEDIRCVEMDMQTAFDQVQNGHICDAKTLLTLNWFEKEKWPTIRSPQA